MGHPVLEAKGITKWFGENPALQDVDLRLPAGVVHGLVGPNGAGKTTLMAALLGLVLPDEGAIQLFGRARSQTGTSWLDGVGGYVEMPRFYPYLTGRRNLEVLAGFDGDSRRDLSELLDLVGLGSSGNAAVRGYSLGMRQRLGLASALLRRPKLLILDEPFNGIDPVGTRDLLGALRTLASAGLTVIMSSHDMGRIEEICDSVTILNQGRVAFDGTIDAMREASPAPAWLLRTSDDRRAKALSRHMAGLAVSVDDRGFVIVASEEDLDSYVRHLVEAGLGIRAMTLNASPLESMFFALTKASEIRPSTPMVEPDP